MTDNNESTGEFILYQMEDGCIRIESWFENETIWLTQALMADLFQVTVPTVNEYLKGIYADGELHPEATIRKFRIVRAASALLTNGYGSQRSRAMNPYRAIRNFRKAHAAAPTPEVTWGAAMVNKNVRFSQHGRLGKVHQLFDKLNAIIEEVNKTLVA